MEPFTMAVVAAIGFGLARGVSNVAEQAVTDAYEGLKTLIVRRLGSDHDVTKALQELERAPDSEGRRVGLDEEVREAGIQGDPELHEAIQVLLDAVSANGASTPNQSITGNYNAQADHGSIATVNVNRPPT